MRVVRWFFGLSLFLAAIFGLVYYLAGTVDGPAIVIAQPSIVGQDGSFDVTVTAPAARLTTLTVQLEQQKRHFPIFDMASAPASASVADGDSLHLKGALGRSSLPDLQSGSATLHVTASRPVLWGLRQASSAAAREIQVRLTPPRLAIASTHHYVNLGGSEMVVYRTTPIEVESGIRVGNLSYPGFSGSGAWLKDPDLKVAFFPLLYNQETDTPMEVFARDAVGNQARAQFDHRVFPKAFRNSRIALDDKFLSRVVPAILQGSPQMKTSADDLLPAFLKINTELRRMNNETIAALARKTAPRILWDGAFQPLGGSQIESSFADFRTYTYGGKEVDRQVHLGFDLAKTANAPVTSANRGTVLFAAELGIYGNAVIVDHGMGVQSLYAHLSSFAVHVGDDVAKGQTLGASGQTGMAGGDHLHFSMLVNGQFVNATEWWDSHWIEDRVLRKLRDAGADIPGASRQ